MEIYYKNTSKICNVTFICQNFRNKFQKRKKIEKINMDSEKSINLFKIKKSHLVIYGTLFWQFVDNFSALLLSKMFLKRSGT